MIRSEYTHAAVFNQIDQKYEVTAFHHENGKAKVIGRKEVNFWHETEACANRLISAHMEKVKQKNHHD